MFRRVTGFAWLIVSVIALSASGCKTVVGNTALWIRPATGFAPRAVENGDGETIFMERFEPKGDSLMIMFRFTPNETPKNPILSGKLPKKLEK